jgi:2-polyprenyl-6-methoxyphenol hydroxylase-like FAD-dependent oxidoreductase
MRVLMVGAGIAGSTLAYCLRRLEHQPTLVDWAPEMRRGGYLVDY